MQIIQNKLSDLILSGKRPAFTVFPFIFVRRNTRITERLLNHQQTHLRQQLEMLIAFYFLWYAAEWLIRAAGHRSSASERISLEQEAHLNERNDDYFFERRPFAWLQYLTA